MTSKTEGIKNLNICELCKYFHLEVREGGGWLGICEATGRRVIVSDEGLNKSDNCPFMANLTVQTPHALENTVTISEKL